MQYQKTIFRTRSCQETLVRVDELQIKMSEQELPLYVYSQCHSHLWADPATTVTASGVYLIVEFYRTFTSLLLLQFTNWLHR